MIGSACAASRLLGLDKERIRNAIGIAAYQATFIAIRGFMGPHTKVLTLAVPAMLGVMAARLAEGVSRRLPTFWGIL
ncbi:MAG: MmgE/PrpD family protein [Candidatus Baldrarchaeia archaeon]